MATRRDYKRWRTEVIEEGIVGGGGSVPFIFNIARGQVFDFEGQQYLAEWQFGFNVGVPGSEEAITDLADGRYPFPTGAETLSVVSDSDDDDKDAGVGARSVTIEGLDTNYEILKETIELEGQVPVTTLGSFLRVQRAYIATAGVNNINDGDITISNSTDDIALILAEEGTTLMAIYTVPLGYTGYLIKFDAASAGLVTVAVRMRIRETGKPWRTREFFTTRTNSIDLHFEPPLPLPQKTDVEVTGDSFGAPAPISASFGVILVPNPT